MENQKKYKKFTKSQRKNISGIIREFMRANPDAKTGEIAEHLNKMKIPHANPGEWTTTKVCNFMAVKPVRVHRRENGRDEVPKAKTSSDKVAVAEIVLASDLSSNEKQRVLETLFAS